MGTTLLIQALVGLLSFVITYVMLSQVIKIANERQIFDQPNERKIHKNQISNLGGVGIFFGITASFLFLKAIGILDFKASYLLAMFLMFLLGLRDDLVPLSPKSKLSFQVITIALMAIEFPFIGALEIGVGYEIAFLLGMLIFSAAYVNAFNLIDGIDGLSGGIGTLILFSFLAVFSLVGAYEMVLVSSLTIGALLGFLNYNLSSTPEKKIFMGDSGTLFIGMMITIFSLEYFSMYTQFVAEGIQHPLLLLACIIGYPVVDLARVSIIRITNGKSPFQADRNHIHHRLLGLGYSHQTSSAILWILSSVVILLGAYFQNHLLVEIILIIGGTLSLLIAIMIYFRIQKNHKRMEQLESISK